VFGVGGRGLAPGSAREGRSHVPGRSRGPAATRSACARGGSPSVRSRADTRPKGRGRRLKDIGPVLEALQTGGTDWAWNKPTLGPRLETWVTPEGPGVLLPPKFGRAGRYGLLGLQPSAKAQIGDTLSLMEDYIRTPALWTVTLPDEDYELLRENGGWPVFQRAVADLLARHLRAAGDPALVLAVVELGLKRTTRTGRPMPHIHVVCSGWGKREPSGEWLLRPAVMDRLVADACRAAGLPDRERAAGSRLEAIRKSVRAYLSPYLKKGSSVSEADTSDGWDALVPHQWWNRSQEAKALRDGHIWKLPRDFAAFVDQQRRRLEKLHLGAARMVCIGRRKGKTFDLPVEVLCFRWDDVEALQQGLEWFAVWRAGPLAFEELADRCTSLRTLACDGADVGMTAPQQTP
jgi:CRP-like cAMP-binding protein